MYENYWILLVVNFWVYLKDVFLFEMVLLMGIFKGVVIGDSELDYFYGILLG